MYNSKLCCAVTGAGGYLGAAICGRLRSDGVEVLELNRRGVAARRDDRAMAFRLGADVPPQAFAGVDVLIHCAYDFKVNSWRAIRRVNVEGTRRLLAAARAGGVQRIIVISTISAFAGCRSLYGRAKLQIEQDAASYDAAIVRPGLVYDAQAPRGVVGALARVVELSPVVPLVGGGRQVLYPCHIDDLTALIAALYMRDEIPTGVPIIAASATGMTLREILAAMARERGKSRWLVPIPAAPLLMALKAAEAVGVRTRLRSDSLTSLMNQAPSVDFAPLADLGVHFRGLELRRAAAPSPATQPSRQA